MPDDREGPEVPELPEMTREHLALLKAQIDDPQFQLMILHYIHKTNYPVRSVG
jgi:hypothetical protein